MIRATDKSGQKDEQVDIYVNGTLKGSGEAFHSDYRVFSPGTVILKKISVSLLQKNFPLKPILIKLSLGESLDPL